jgi:hypothetical protein
VIVYVVSGEYANVHYAEDTDRRVLAVFESREQAQSLVAAVDAYNATEHIKDWRSLYRGTFAVNTSRANEWRALHPLGKALVDYSLNVAVEAFEVGKIGKVEP